METHFPACLPSSPRLNRSREAFAWTLAAGTLALALAGAARAQGPAPKLFLKFDGNLADAAPSPVITSITGTSSTGGWTPSPSDYGTDRNGVASKALTFSGSRSLQLLASSLPNNSNQALGLRNAGGTNTSFTLAAWVLFTSSGSGQGYSTIFGNLGTGAGTLHAGLNENSRRTHFGFDGNDVNGGTNDLGTNVWYHVAYVYDTTTQTSGSGSPPSQRIYINGIPEVSRWTVTNTLKAADLLLGNWSSANDSSRDLKGRLDEVVVYNTALKPDQVQALYQGVDPNALPAAGTYFPPRLPGVFGAPGSWGIREIKALSGSSVNGIGYGTLVNADRIIRSNPTSAQATIAEYPAPGINFLDDEGAGNAGYFPNEGDFGTNTPAGDDNLLMVARCAVRIPTAGNWTFGFRGDDGSRLRVIGRAFASSTRINTGNVADPAHNGDGIFHSNSTGDSNTLGVVNFPAAGDYKLEFVWWEGGGGSSIEVFAAPGAKTSVDGTFQLIGNTAAGGLEIVRDPDLIPTFTVNGGNAVFVHGGSPATLTLAWSVANPTTSLSIDQGVGAVAQSGSLNVPAPAATTTYTITASTPVAGGTDVVTNSVTVHVDSPPFIRSFSANDATVTAGSTVNLSWSVDGATTLTLLPGNINVTGQSSRNVTVAADTTYTLVATNPAGPSQQALTVDVGTPPAIHSFAISDATPLYGAEVLLSWDTGNATTLSINQGVGSLTGASGSVPVTPFLTTTWTLSAGNDYGTSTAAVTANLATPVGVDAAGFTVTRYNATTAFPFTGMGYLQSADALIAGTNLSGAPVTVTGVTAINYADGASGDFGSDSAFPGGTGNGVTFALRITGTLVVNTPGEYNFVLNSDDGGRLRVDGRDVIVDDSTHSPNANAGRVTLTKPGVPIELVYYNAPGNGGSTGAEVELAWIRPNLQWQLVGTAAATTPVVRGKVLISEFMADNAGTLLDEDGNSSDWIEVWNSTSAAVDMAGYYLTDEAAVPDKWPFPAVTLAANEFRVVFASAKDRRNPAANLHTNFALEKSGDYLALTKADGNGGFEVVSAFAPLYPPQTEDVSYGSSDAEGYTGFMEVPSPGSSNAATCVDFVADTTFADAATGQPRPRGRCAGPFNLVIACATPGASIRFTTDGSTPTASRGTVYTGPIPIGATTVVRAAAFKFGWKASNVDTQTYLFLDDIVTQTAATATARGFPSGTVNGQIFRYGLALGNVTAAGGTLQNLKDALAAAPSVCLTTDIANLVNASTGIYVNPGRHGLFWERPVSLESISPAGTSEFQIDCGARMRGGFSRSTSNPKHAFHLYFRGSLYDGDLKYRLFGVNGASRFDQLDMRCEQNYSWSFQNDAKNTLLREEWTRQTQGDMGQPYARNGYFHLYLNGIYWGVYCWEERTEAAWGETYLGGQKDDIDVVKSAGSSGGYNTEMTDGNFIAWKSLCDQAIALKNDATEAGRTAKYMQLRGLNPDGTRNASFPVLLDVDNLADYLLIVFYDGSYDSPLSTFLSNASNNWFGLRDRLGTRGFVFSVHDHEHGMDTGQQSYNRIGPWGDPNATGNNWGQTWNTGQYRTRETFSKSNPQYLHELLCFSAEYRQRFADRVQKHLFNGGALTTTAALARLDALNAQVDPLVHAEAARWGSATLNRNSWLTAKTTVTNFINNGGTPQTGQYAFTSPYQGGRTLLIVEQLRGYQDPVGTPKPLFPPATLSAPVISGPFGGPVGIPHGFQLSNPNAGGVVYYTIDGTDPRTVGGGVAAGALGGAAVVNVSLTSTATVRARVLNGVDWSALVEADFLVGALAGAGNLVISEIHYNPPGSSNLEQFVEVANISGSTIDLTGVRCTLGIQAQFPDGFTLPPGGRAVLIRDLAAFAAAFPGVPGGQIAAVFANGTNLDPNGERIQLLDAADAVIRDFTYDDKLPWPEEPDGSGPSLVLKRPATNPDHALAANWRASAGVSAAPGRDDGPAYADWAATHGVADPTGTGNDDADGLPNLAEYFLGSDPQRVNPLPGIAMGTQTFDVGGVVEPYLTLTVIHPVGRDDVTCSGEANTHLSQPWSAAVLVAGPTRNLDGTETFVYRHPRPAGADRRQFLRLRLTRLP